MNLSRLTALGVALLATATVATGQRPPREIEPGSRIETLAFEHVYGAGAPERASDVSIPELRGRVLILEYWATW